MLGIKLQRRLDTVGKYIVYISFSMWQVGMCVSNQTQNVSGAYNFVTVRQIIEYNSFPFTYFCSNILFQNAVLLFR